MYFSLHRNCQSCWWSWCAPSASQRMWIGERRVTRQCGWFCGRSKIVSVILNVSGLYHINWNNGVDQSAPGGSIIPRIGVEYLLWQRIVAAISHRRNPCRIWVPCRARRNGPRRHNRSQIVCRAALALGRGCPIFVELDGISSSRCYHIVVDEPASTPKLHGSVISSSGDGVRVNLSSAVSSAIAGNKAEAMSVVKVGVCIWVIIDEGVVP